MKVPQEFSPKMSDDEEISDIASRRICCDCVQEEYLSTAIQKTGETAECYYCLKTQKTFSIDEMADEIEAAFERHYVRTSIDPSGYEYALQKEGLWERAGETVGFTISEAAEIDEEPSEDVRQILDDRTYDHELAQMGEENPFEEEAQYEAKSANDIEFQLEWAEFERGIQIESRFFSKSGQSLLDSIFGEITQLQSADGKPVVVEAGPDGVIKSLYRARPFQSFGELSTALKRPDLGLGPPPSRRATAGRMNPQGIAVFYGAEGEGVAIAEVRPPVGGQVVVGRFDIVRPLSLLDVKALQEVFVTGSIFDSDFIRRLEHAKFLESLSSRFSRPVMPSDEPFDYLVTQAIAEYLSEIPDPKLDGIIYPSVQVGTQERNVVLFHHAARVRHMELPEDTELTVHSGYETDEEYEIDYSVCEEVPPPQPDSQEGETARHEVFLSMLVSSSRFNGSDQDLRQETLDLDLESVAVHHVKSIKHKTSRHSVSRRRSVKREEPF